MNKALPGKTFFFHRTFFFLCNPIDALRLIITNKPFAIILQAIITLKTEEYSQEKAR